MVRMAIPTIPSSGFCFQAPGKPPTKQAAMALRFHLSYLLSKAWDVHGWIIGIQINWNDASLLWKVYIVILLPILDFRCEVAWEFLNNIISLLLMNMKRFQEMGSLNSWDIPTCSKKWCPKIYPEWVSACSPTQEFENIPQMQRHATNNPKEFRLRLPASTLSTKESWMSLRFSEEQQTVHKLSKTMARHERFSELSSLSRLSGVSGCFQFFLKGDDDIIYIYKYISWR